MSEAVFQRNLIKKLKRRFPGCEIFKQDPQSLQGICDLLILFEDKWAMLEVKKSADAARQPNQDYYVEKFGRMSFARFIYPENEEEVLDDLQQTFASRRTARVS